MTKVDAALDAVNEVAEALAQSTDRIECAHLQQEMRRRVEKEIAKARGDESSYEVVAAHAVCEHGKPPQHCAACS